MTGGRHSMSAFQIRDGLFARLHAIEKMADMQPELLPGVAGFVLDGLCPELVRPGLLHALRPTEGMRPGELGNGVLRRDLAIALQGEAGARDQQASLRTTELQSALHLAGA